MYVPFVILHNSGNKLCQPINECATHVSIKMMWKPYNIIRVSPSHINITLSPQQYAIALTRVIDINIRVSSQSPSPFIHFNSTKT